MRVLLAIPLLVLLVAFALSNPQVVPLGLWPTDILVRVPISVAVLIGAGVFFVLGAFMTWTTALAMTARARKAERHVRQLEGQVEALRAKPVAPVGTAVMLPPG